MSRRSLGFGYLAAAHAPSLAMYALAHALLIGLRGSSITFGPRMADVSHWVEKRRATAAKPAPRFATVEAPMARMAAANPHLSPEQAAHLGRHSLRQFPDGWGWKTDPQVSQFPPEDFSAETSAVWDAIACPTLLFWGTACTTTNPETDGRRAHFKDHRTVVYEGAGHWLHHERFDDFMAELRNFL